MTLGSSKYVAAFDLGTTSARVIIFDEYGSPQAACQRPLTQIFPKEGWVEQDPMEMFRQQLACFKGALSDLNILPSDISAIGITNQRETTVVWEKATGRPIYPAIVWQDHRTTEQCEALGAHSLMIRERTGLKLDPYFSATKIRWILDHVSGARAKAQAGELLFGTVDSWLIWNLTGGKRHMTDITNASRTLLANIRTGRWDEELLGMFGVPASMLPEITPCCGMLAESDPEVLGALIPISGTAGDQQSAAIGQACFRPGMTKNTYGTGGFLLMNTGKTAPLSDHLLSTVGWEVGGDRSYALEGSVFIAGAVVQWLKDGLGLFRTSAEIETLASQVQDNGEVYLVPAFVGLGAPYWDPFARGMIIGITRGTSRAHIARAALESIAFQCNEVLQVMAADTGAPVEELRVDGGAAENDLLMQFQADLANVPVVRPVVTETTALGAAYLAGLGIGLWEDFSEIESLWRRERIFEPKMSQDRREYLTKQWHRAVARTRGWEQ